MRLMITQESMLKKNYRGINILLGSESLFSSGEANLTGAGKQTIDELCLALDSIVGKYNLTMDIEGHTDDTPHAFVQIPFKLGALFGQSSDRSAPND